MTATIERDDGRRAGLPGRWVRTVPRAGGPDVYVEVPDGWLWLPGWPGWAKWFPRNFTGITDPIKKRVWRRAGTVWALEGALHERHHPAWQANRLGRFIFSLHILRYLTRGYPGSRMEQDANAGRDRALAWWRAHGCPTHVPLAANHWDGVLGSVPVPVAVA